MKKTIMRMLMLATAAMAASGADRLYFATDFEFSVRGKTLPAGSYAVEKVRAESAGVRVINLKTGLSAMTVLSVASQAKPGTRPVIEFACKGSDCKVAGVSHLSEGLVHRTPTKPGMRWVVMDLRSAPVKAE